MNKESNHGSFEDTLFFRSGTVMQFYAGCAQLSYRPDDDDQIYYQLGARFRLSAVLPRTSRCVIDSRRTPFYDGMRDICRSYENLRQSLRRKEHREIRLGMAIQEYVEVRWLRRFEETFPEYKLYFSFDETVDLENNLADGILDGFVFSDAQSASDPLRTSDYLPLTSPSSVPIPYGTAMGPSTPSSVIRPL